MPVNFRGKDYNTVIERLEPAHGQGARPIGIKSVVTEVRPAGQITAVHAAITFDDGRVFTGMSEIKFDATSGADKDAPLECAETSAVGRALQFAGYYGSDDGLAGAEEVRTATQRRENRERTPGVPTRAASPINSDLGRGAPGEIGRPGQVMQPGAEATPPQLRMLHALSKQLRDRPVPDGLNRGEASALISTWQAEVGTGATR